MDNEESTPPQEEPKPVDISSQFQEMGFREWLEFRMSDVVRNAAALKIVVDYTTLVDARRLKAFLEDFNAPSGQKRYVVIRATESQMKEAANVFASGVEWEKV